MKKRILGNSGLEVSAIGMGCMNLSFGTGKAVDISEGVKVIRAPHPARAGGHLHFTT